MFFDPVSKQHHLKMTDSGKLTNMPQDLYYALEPNVKEAFKVVRKNYLSFYQQSKSAVPQAAISGGKVASVGRNDKQGQHAKGDKKSQPGSTQQQGRQQGIGRGFSPTYLPLGPQQQRQTDPGKGHQSSYGSSHQFSQVSKGNKGGRGQGRGGHQNSSQVSGWQAGGRGSGPSARSYVASDGHPDGQWSQQQPEGHYVQGTLGGQFVWQPHPNPQLFMGTMPYPTPQHQTSPQFWREDQSALVHSAQANQLAVSRSGPPHAHGSYIGADGYVHHFAESFSGGGGGGADFRPGRSSQDGRADGF